MKLTILVGFTRYRASLPNERLAPFFATISLCMGLLDP